MNKIANTIINNQLIKRLVDGCWNILYPQLQSITKQYINDKKLIKDCLTYDFEQLKTNLKKNPELAEFSSKLENILEDQVVDLILDTFKKDVFKIKGLDEKRYKLKQQGLTDKEVDQEFFKYYGFAKNTIQEIHNQLVKRYIDQLKVKF